MDDNILKLDLDLETKSEVLDLLKIRLAYMHDLGFFPFEAIQSIDLLRKSSYGALITLKEGFPDPMYIIMFQLFLGSDYRKEINTLINHRILGMEYSNRLFTTKRYKGDIIKTGVLKDVTEDIAKYIYDDVRKKNAI